MLREREEGESYYLAVALFQPKQTKKEVVSGREEEQREHSSHSLPQGHALLGTNWVALSLAWMGRWSWCWGLKEGRPLSALKLRAHPSTAEGVDLLNERTNYSLPHRRKK